MTDDTIEITEDMPFHPTDSPRGMHYYNMNILTDAQQRMLNDCKQKHIRTTETYLNDNPTVRALVALIYRVVLRTQPMRNLHVTIAEYFSKPKAEIQKDVNEYLQRMAPRSDKFLFISKSVGDDDFVADNSESEINSITYADQKEKARAVPISVAEVKGPEQLNIRNDSEFMQTLLTEHLHKELDKRLPALELSEYDLKDIALASILPEDSKMDESIKERRIKTFIEDADKTEEKWLVTINKAYSDRYNSLIDTVLSEYVEPARARKWFVLQMTSAERQWNLLQAALQGRISPEAQDALREWQALLMNRTQNDMSPEMKETQMDWMEGQLTVGGATSTSIGKVLELWQSHILVLGSTMSPAMVRTELDTLQQEMQVAQTLSTDAKLEQTEKIRGQIKQMERIETMMKSMQNWKRLNLQNAIDNLVNNGTITFGVLQLLADLLKLEKEHGVSSEEEFKARMEVVTDEMKYDYDSTYDTILAQKKWIKWQLAERKISPEAYESKREFLNYQLDRIGCTSSQTLIRQMEWLDNELKNNFITKQVHDVQKVTLEYRLADQYKETIPRLEEQIKWLDMQFRLGKMSDNNHATETGILKQKLENLIADGKSIDDLQYDMKLLQQQFGLGQMPENEFQTKKKNLRERIAQLKKTTPMIAGEHLEDVDSLLRHGSNSDQEYDEKRQAVQTELGSKMITGDPDLSTTQLRTSLPVFSQIDADETENATKEISFVRHINSTEEITK